MFLELVSQALGRVTLRLGLSTVFFILRFGLCVLGRKMTETVPWSRCMPSGASSVSAITDAGHWMKEVSASCSTVKLIYPFCNCATSDFETVNR